MKKFLTEEASLEKCLQQLCNKDDLMDNVVVEHNELYKSLLTVKGHIDKMGQWDVKVYDIGELIATFC